MQLLLCIPFPLPSDTTYPNDLFRAVLGVSIGPEKNSYSEIASCAPSSEPPF